MRRRRRIVFETIGRLLIEGRLFLGGSRVMVRRQAAFGVGVMVLMGIAACQSTARHFGDPKATGGLGGTAGTSEPGKSGAAGSGGGTAGKPEAGSAQGGDAGADDSGGEAGSAGSAGESNGELTIAPPQLANGQTNVPYTGTLSASGGAKYTWSVTSGELPRGLTLKGTSSPTLEISGTPGEVGQFPVTLSVSDGSLSASVDVTLTITHTVLYLSDPGIPGLDELFVSSVGGEVAPTPYRLNGPLNSGTISSFAWSPDGNKVLYRVPYSDDDATGLWLASLDSPGTAQRVSAPGVAVSEMAWLNSGNIAAYSTASGDVYLVDLSAAKPGTSKFAYTSPTGIVYGLTPSPVGSALIAGNIQYHYAVVGYTYVTWNNGNPATVTLDSEEPATGSGIPNFSPDGRFASAGTASGTEWWDLSLAKPIKTLLGRSTDGTWSPSASKLLYSNNEVNTAGLLTISRDDFSAGAAPTEAYVYGGSCSRVSSTWSPDGKHALITCGSDVRGVSNVETTQSNKDFTLLPSDFLSNSSTETYNAGWSPDSKWVALLADHDTNSHFDLYLVRWAAPGIAYRTHGNSIAPGVTNWTFAPNSRALAFVGSISPQSNEGLYFSALPTSGAPPLATLVSSPSATVQPDTSWLPGSHVLTYRAAINDVPSLYAVLVASDGSLGKVVPLSGATGNGNGVRSYQLAPLH